MFNHEERIAVLERIVKDLDSRSDDRFSDADILRSAVGLLRVYRDETIAKMVPAERHPFLRKITPDFDALTGHDSA